MNEQVQQIFIEDIIPNRFQPRLTFDEKDLQNLADSIKVHGVIQPLVLRRVGNKYEIIAGERRYKASCMAGLKQVPAIVREMNDNESAEVALIENIQRKNLSSIEEAQSYKNLLNRGYLTQDELANKLGVSQPTIANKLRLLNLCDEVQNALLNEQISERHARSLLQLANPDDQKAMLNRIIKERLTVKQLDNEIKKKLNGENSTAGDPGTANIMTPTLEGGPTMNIPQDDMMGGNNTPLMDPNKNMFGFAMTPPTDLEATPTNMSIGEEEIIPTASFNPFATPQQPIVPPVEGTPVTNMVNPMPLENNQETIETFDMFGDIVTDQSQLGVDPGAQQAPKASIGDQINTVRNAIKNVETNGYRVEVEEYDFEDMYQMVVKIKK